MWYSKVLIQIQKPKTVKKQIQAYTGEIMDEENES